MMHYAWTSMSGGRGVGVGYGNRVPLRRAAYGLFIRRIRVTEGSPELIECISWNGQPLAYIVRAEFTPAQTTFFTPPDLKQQVGYVVYPGGSEIPRHTHRDIERRLIGTSEVLVVRHGRCEIDIYNPQREVVATRELRDGDVMLMVGGGHGFRILDDTVFLEIKQGPYTGLDEKERF